MPNDVPDWTLSTLLAPGASVTLLGTANVNIANTPSVVISGTASVNVANTPTVNIGGTVTANITAGTVAVQNVANGILTSAGNLRYIATQSYSGPGFTTVTFTLSALDRAIVVFFVPSTQTGGASSVIRVGPQSRAFYTLWANPYVLGVPQIAANQSWPFVAYANPAITTAWLAEVSVGAGETGSFVVFADTALPERGLISDQVPSPARLIDYTSGLPVSSTHPLPVGAGPRARPYDSMLTSAPVGGTLASVTFPATPGFRWMIDHAEWSLEAGTAVAIGANTQIKDGSTVIYTTRLAIPATIAQTMLDSVGPGAAYTGSSGAAVTVTFSGIPAAAIETVTAGAYLVPG